MLPAERVRPTDALHSAGRRAELQTVRRLQALQCADGLGHRLQDVLLSVPVAAGSHRADGAAEQSDRRHVRENGRRNGDVSVVSGPLLCAAPEADLPVLAGVVGQRTDAGPDDEQARLRGQADTASATDQAEEYDLSDAVPVGEGDRASVVVSGTAHVLDDRVVQAGHYVQTAVQ